LRYDTVGDLHKMGVTLVTRPPVCVLWWRPPLRLFGQGRGGVLCCLPLLARYQSPAQPESSTSAAPASHHPAIRRRADEAERRPRHTHVPYSHHAGRGHRLACKEWELLFELVEAGRTGPDLQVAISRRSRSPRRSATHLRTFRPSAEAGHTGRSMSQLVWVSFPAGTPPAIVQKNNKAMQELPGRARASASSFSIWVRG